MALDKEVGLLNKFTEAYKSSPRDMNKCKEMLLELKRAIVGMKSFSPDEATSPTKAQEFGIARDTLEYAVLLCAEEGELEEMEKNMAYLKRLYATTPGGQFGSSDRQWLIVGLNLLRLLVKNELTDFHTELELIPEEQQSNQSIKYVKQLERYLMEGSYSKLLSAGKSAPSHEYVRLIKELETTVQGEIGRCREAAYKTAEQADAERRGVPFGEFSKTLLGYAHEMERIV